jgi:hypothetical protein
VREKCASQAERARSNRQTVQSRGGKVAAELVFHRFVIIIKTHLSISARRLPKFSPPGSNAIVAVRTCTSIRTQTYNDTFSGSTAVRFSFWHSIFVSMSVRCVSYNYAHHPLNDPMTTGLHAAESVPCSIAGCAASTTSWLKLSAHVRRAHTRDQYPYVCDVCTDERFPSAKALKNHTHRVHNARRVGEHDLHDTSIP